MSKRVASYDKYGRFVRAYDSTGKAARAFGTYDTNIYKAIRKGILCKGFYWRYVISPFPFYIDVPKYRRSRARKIEIYTGPPVMRVAVAGSIKEAAEITDLSWSTVKKHLKGKLWTNSFNFRHLTPSYFFVEL